MDADRSMIQDKVKDKIHAVLMDRFNGVSTSVMVPKLESTVVIRNIVAIINLG